MSQHPEWLRPEDAAILSYLSRERPDYVPLIANRLGLHLSYAERRCDRLAEAELVEPVSGEVVYRITERGDRCLESFEENAGTSERSRRHATGDD